MSEDDKNDRLAAMMRARILAAGGLEDDQYRDGGEGAIKAKALDKKVKKILGILNGFGQKPMHTETRATCLLANLMHFCALEREDFGRAIRVSADAFEAESGGAEPQGLTEADMPVMQWKDEDELGALLDRFGGATEPREDQLTDIIADLRHACAALDMNFDQILKQAQLAYDLQGPVIGFGPK